LIHQFLDFDDYKTPIKNFYDDTFQMHVHSSEKITKRKTMFVKKNLVTLNDDPFSTGLNMFNSETQEKVFYSVDRSTFDTLYEFGDILAQFIFVADDREDFYTRNVYNIFDLTGQLGGVFEIFDITGRIFIVLIASKLFEFSVITQLYQVKVPKAEFTAIVLPKPTVYGADLTKRKPGMYEEQKDNLNENSRFYDSPDKTKMSKFKLRKGVNDNSAVYDNQYGEDEYQDERQHERKDEHQDENVETQMDRF
jgi:hypothetical protein